MRRREVAASAALPLVLSTALGCGAGVQRLRIVDHVRPVCSRPGEGPAVLLVNVIDHNGDPMDGVPVSLAWERGGGATSESLTDQDGKARWTLDRDGHALVAAHFVGFARSVADHVEVRRGCLTAVSLPLQVEPVKSILSTEQ